MYRSVKVINKATDEALSPKACELLARTVRERSGVGVSGSSDDAYAITLAIDKTIGSEGFRIARDTAGATIAAKDGRGLLYGVGRLLRDCQYLDGGIVPGSWTGTRVPQLPVRGIYFATHFHNFYHDAPLEEVVRYVEELSLWGCNSLMVWFDMHHYSGIDDTAAAPMIARLHAILKAANGVGMGVGILFLANEAYHTSPRELRVTPARFQYNVEVCPSKPGGIELIVKWRRELLERFADIDVEYVCYWPHDQGGCGCRECNPWGGRAYVDLIRQLNPVVNEIFPRAKKIISTWCFDYAPDEMVGEYEGLWNALKQAPSLTDYLMVDAHAAFPPFVLEHGRPAGIPIVNFTEISMMGQTPWGGFGHNPLPQHIDRMWQPSRHLMSGGFPYSEGIYEDINKAIMLQLYWEPGRQVRDIVREYAAYEWSWEHAEALTNVAMRLGDGAQWDLNPELKLEVFGAAPAAVGPGDALPRSTSCYALPRYDGSAENTRSVTRAAASVSRYTAGSWRWRTLWLRVMIEDELRRSGGRPTDQSDRCFDELASIYHAAHADACVSPPTSRFVAGLMKNVGVAVR